MLLEVCLRVYEIHTWDIRPWCGPPIYLRRFCVDTPSVHSCESDDGDFKQESNSYIVILILTN